MIGNRRLGIGSGAEASSFSFTHAATGGEAYYFAIATSTGFFKVKNAVKTSNTTTSDITTLSATPAYALYLTSAGTTVATVFSTDSAGTPMGTITQLQFSIATALLGGLDISKCAKSLTFLNIGSQTNISSVTGLSSCKALTELRVNGCGFTSLDCTPLTELVTVLANDQSSLTAFTAGAKLKSLTIFKCPQLPTAAFFLSAANNTLEFLDCHECPYLGDLQLGYGSFTTNPLLMNLANLKVLDVSNTTQQSSLSFWPVASKTTLQSVTATSLDYISSLSLVYGYNTAAPWTALTSLNLSGSTLQNDPWRIPTTVSALNLQDIKFGETQSAPMGIDLTGCTLLTDWAAVFGDMSGAITTATSATTMTTTSARELILDGSGFTSINIQQTGFLTTYPLLKLSAQSMPNLTSFTLGNPAWLKTIQITNNPKLASVSITGASNRTLVDISVTISGNTLLTTRTLTGSGTIPWTSRLILPTITSVSPNYGPLAGGTAITIMGTNLTGATVTVAGATATSVVILLATTVTAKTPAGSAGQKSVLVTTAGTSVVTTAPATNFNYQTIPTFTSMSPIVMAAAGGTINLTGSGFLSVTNISFTGTSTQLTNISIASDTQMSATVPARAVTSGWSAGNAYPKSITVFNPYGSKAYGGTAILGFYYST